MLRLQRLDKKVLACDLLQKARRRVDGVGGFLVVHAALQKTLIDDRMNASFPNNIKSIS
jgi:hypothetical protein